MIKNNQKDNKLTMQSTPKKVQIHFPMMRNQLKMKNNNKKLNLNNLRKNQRKRKMMTMTSI